MIPAKFVTPDARTLASLVGMGVIPTIIGHTLNQVMSRRVSPVWVSLMSPGETLIALLLGFVVLNQPIHSHELFGGLFILLGAAATSWSET